jgi:hypothetical protein
MQQFGSLGLEPRRIIIFSTATEDANGWISASQELPAQNTLF